MAGYGSPTFRKSEYADYVFERKFSDRNSYHPSNDGHRRHSHIPEQYKMRRLSAPALSSDEEYGYKDALTDWTQTTSAHGIPHVGASTSYLTKVLWIVVVTLCIFSFFVQAKGVYEKYYRYEKTVSIELIFENVEFPAVTICNLNPYKQSRIKGVPEIEMMLNQYTKAMRASHSNERVKRAMQPSESIPVNSDCYCEEGATECVHFLNSQPTSNETMCICVYDKIQDTAWPCYHEKDWIEYADCTECDFDGFCQLPHRVQTKENKEIHTLEDDRTWRCLCHQESKMHWVCMRHPMAPLYKMWVPSTTVSTTTQSTTTRPTTTTPSPEYIEALGFEGTTDQVALTSKAQENLVFAVASLDKKTRLSMGYGKHEFIQKCSFNGRECDWKTEFNIHVDPVFGNCYTFNFNESRDLQSSKAGPVYGLRFMAFVNVTEYLPTSDQSGVRVAIHDTTAVPFPDVFAYSAPTGFITSFGVTLQKVDRLGPPFGNCTYQGKTMDYIYKNYDYSVEWKLIEKCGCGDPRFPTPKNREACTTENITARNCLEVEIAALGDFQSESFAQLDRCHCKQPCMQWLYDIAFSSAKWPAGAQSQAIDCGAIGISDPDACVAYYQKHAAMVEVYYERHGYEWLIESQAYAWVNAIADIGGHLGIFTGISVITCVEFLVLLWHLFSICFLRRGNKNEPKKKPYDPNVDMWYIDRSTDR